MWQFFAAALFLLSSNAFAEPVVTLSGDGALIEVDGLDDKTLKSIVSVPDAVWLQLTTNDRAESLPLTTSEKYGRLTIQPRFTLLNGRRYRLIIAPAEFPYVDTILERSVIANPTAEVQAVSPNLDAIPANTLRLYVTFSEPMRRGQLDKVIWLEDETGTRISSPFLNLTTELWDDEQKRLTLLLDPGRIKQGVGPNQAVGAPLVAGERVTLVVSDEMLSASGAPMRAPFKQSFEIGAAERRPLKPSVWRIEAPRRQTREPVTVFFDRAIDSEAVKRLLTIIYSDRNAVSGRAVATSKSWSFTPETNWSEKEIGLRIDPGLEDVAGNTVGYAFDAPPGTNQKEEQVVTVEIELRDKSN